MRLNCFPLDVRFDDGGKKLFLDGVELKPSVRTLAEMKPVLFDDGFVNKINEKRILYYMFRGLALKKGFRYDVTVVPALSLGKEFNKTLGHYHALAPSRHSYAEVYEVLKGKAHYLLQKRNSMGGIANVLLVKAKKGDKVFVPPDYGHLTINPSRETLVMANWTTVKESDYAPFIEKRGGAFYELRSRRFVANENYGKLPRLKIVEAEKMPNPFAGGKNIFMQVLEAEKRLCSLGAS